MTNLTAAQELEKAREVTNCPQGVELQEHLKVLVAEVQAAKAAYEIIRHLNVNREEAKFCGIDDCYIDDAVAAMVTPVADSILRAAEARGVDKANEHLLTKFSCTGHVGVPAMALEYLAKQLREVKAE